MAGDDKEVTGGDPAPGPEEGTSPHCPGRKTPGEIRADIERDLGEERAYLRALLFRMKTRS